MNGVGSRVGPDLSDIGALRRTAEIEQSLLDPNAEVLPQNRFYRVVTKQGETITGRLLNLDTFNVRCSIRRSACCRCNAPTCASPDFVKDSPMPSYRDKLSTQELADVVAYLRLPERNLSNDDRMINNSRAWTALHCRKSLRAGDLRPHRERRQGAAELAHLLRQHDEPALQPARLRSRRRTSRTWN